MSTITGSNGGNIIVGTNSGDVINAKGGDDIVIAGNGNDTVDGGSGNDILSGGNGNDTIAGGSGCDLILGENGNDVLDGGAGDDIVLGGAGNDTLIYRSAENQFDYDLYDGGKGQDTLRLVVSAAVFASAAFQADIAQLQAKLAHGSATDYLESIHLQVTSIERLEVVVEGSANQAPTDIALTNNTVAENAAGAVIGTLSTVDPDAGNTHTYTVSDSRFEVVGNSLKLKAGETLDFEGGASITLNVTSTDNGGLSRTESFTINVSNVNETPADIALTGNTVAENAAGAVVGTLSTVDPDVGNTHIYTVSDSRFEVVGNSLKLKAGESLNFEGGSSISLDVTSTDAGGLSRTETFAINVTNVNETPTDIALTGNTVAENAAGAVVGTLSTVDPDVGNTHIYTVSDGRFEVAGNSLKLKAGESLNFEGGSSISLDVTSTDAGGLSRTETFAINVTNVNETPTDIALTGNTVAENAVGAVVGILSTIDPDAGNTHIYTVSDGRFEVAGNSLKLKAGESLNFEGGSSISLDVTSTDAGGLSRTETFAINVTNVNETPTDIALTNNTVAENAVGVAIGALSTADADAGSTHTYGVSDSRFEVVDNILKLQAGVSLDFETEPATNVQVTSTDEGGLARTETFTISVSNANDAPDSISLSASTVKENASGAVIGTLTGTDVDPGDSLTFSVTDTSSPFEVVGNTLQLKAGVSLDFEQDSEVFVTVTATDSSGATFDQGFTVTVGDGFESLGIDGYISGATVFADANDNGVFDNGEATTTTDAFGNFTLFGGSGQLIMSGGIDISTNHAFEGVMRAPEGSTVVTPLTTLVVAIAEATAEASGEPINFASASAQLLEGLGLSEDIDLSTFDPIAATLSSDASAQAQGEAAIAAAVQIQNTIVQAASLLEGAGGSFADAAAAVVAELAVQINAQANADLVIDLNSSGVIQSVINEAALNTANVNQTSVEDTAAGAASVISSSNAVIDAAFVGGQTGTDLLTTLAQVAIVANDAATALVDAGATGDASAAEASFTGAALTIAVDEAEDQVGDVAGVNGNDTVEGTASTDLLQGFGGNDTLNGLEGNDVLDGGDGDDILDGGDGRDRATYAEATGAITVALAAGTVTGPGMGSDTLISVEQVRGSNFGDTFNASGFGLVGAANVGSNGATNLFEGMGGNDLITGNGNTQVSYRSATAGVTVNLAGTATGDVSVGADTFTGVFGVLGSQFGDTLTGTGAGGIEQYNGGAGNDFIDGLGGNDRASYSSFVDDTVTGGVTINMALGTVTGDASVGTDTLRSVEFIRGSNFADTYDATGFSNASTNAGSNNTFNEIEGMGGNDTVTGNGNTRIAFYNATGAVTVDLLAGTATGDSSVGNDTIIGGVNQIAGSAFGDTFFGSNNASNTSEQFEGRGGNDSFDGRGGFDQAVYGNDNVVATGISINMAAGTVTGDAAIGTDTLRSIEAVRGTNFADTYDATDWATASALNVGNLGTIGAFGGSLNEFEGLGGNDIITGSGDTRISYASSSGGVTVDLAAGTAIGNGSVGTDTITGGVARVRGSNNNDTISGDGAANNLEGQSGNDRLDGRGGNDLLTGGGNADTFVYTNGGGNDNVIDFNRVQGDKIDLSGVTGMFSLADVQAIASASGNGTILNFGGFTNTLFLSNIAVGSLVGSDFVFATTNNPPTDIQLSNAAIVENSSNGTVVGALTATDPGDTSTFSLLDNAGGRFAISGGNLVVNGALDFELTGSHQVTVRVTDSASQTYDETFTINVTEVNDVAPTITSGATASEAENTAIANVVYQAAATDPDTIGTVSYSLSGDDALLFDIDGTGAVTFKVAPNFEAPTDSNGNNVYDIVVHANDGIHDTTQNVAITVTDVNDVAPSFTSGATASEAENTAISNVVYDAAATDPDTVGTLTYSLSGTDALLFDIDIVTGAVTFKVSPNYEAPADSNGNNVYDIVVHANDGIHDTTQNVAITVTDANDVAPTITSGATASEAENTAISNVVYDAAATDPDTVGTLTYSLSGTDALLFDIDSGTGAVTFIASPDFEAPADANGDNIYDIVVHANDGVQETTKDVAITVTDVNNVAPLISVMATDGVGTEATGDSPDFTFTFARTGDTSQALTVNYSIFPAPIDGAQPGSDFPASSTITFAAGSATAVLSFDAFDDAVAENTEVFSVSVGVGEGYDIDFQNASAFATITDNDAGAPPPALVSVAATDGAGTEASGDSPDFTFTFARAGDTSQALTVNYSIVPTPIDGAQPGTDFPAQNGTITFAAGSATAVLTFDAIDDALIENTEGFSVVVGVGVGYDVDFPNATAGATITDNDVAAPLPTLSIADASANEEAGTMTFTVTLSAAAAGPVSFTYSTADNTAGALDYETVAGQLVTIPAGETSALITIALTNDALIEGAGENFFVNLSNPAGATIADGQATGTIVEQDQLINGTSGPDTLNGGAGDDTLDGGTGRDRVSYADATGGITVNLAAGTVSGAGVGSDTLLSIEQLIGSDFADTFVVGSFSATSANAGSNGAINLFEGRAGNDIITGNDSTQVSYRSATGAVTVNIGAGTASGDASVGADLFTGVNSVLGSGFGDNLTGSNANDQFNGGAGDDTISGGQGTDRAAYFSFVDDTVTAGVTINMAAGTVVGDDASVGTDTLVSIETIRGSSFADIYIGSNYSTGSNGLLNNGTFNEFEGMGGNDSVIGNGNTRLVFLQATDGVTVDLAAGTASGDASVGNDTINTNGGILINGFTGGINAVFGSLFDDVLRGSTNANQTSEVFDGRGGDDLIDGRGAFDQAVYSNDPAVTAGIIVAMAAGTVTGDIFVGTDTLRSTESVRGTNHIDTYDATGWATAGALNIGSSGTIGPFGGSLNEFEGMGGNDVITGSGDTRISFVNASGFVTVDLVEGTAVGNGSVGSDTIIGGVARVRGSNGNDFIYGDGGNNTLEGQGGNDTIAGRGGSDALTGGAGNDTFVFYAVSDSSGGAVDTIADFAVGVDKLDFSAIDANIGDGVNDVFLFGGQNNSVVANSVTWFQSGGNTTVQADINGDATADLTITLTGLKTLGASDFLL